MHFMSIISNAGFHILRINITTITHYETLMVSISYLKLPAKPLFSISTFHDIKIINGSNFLLIYASFSTTRIAVIPLTLNVLLG